MGLFDSLPYLREIRELKALLKDHDVDVRAMLGTALDLLLDEPPEPPPPEPPIAAACAL